MLRTTTIKLKLIQLNVTISTVNPLIIGAVAALVHLLFNSPSCTFELVNSFSFIILNFYSGVINLNQTVWWSVAAVFTTITWATSCRSCWMRILCWAFFSYSAIRRSSSACSSSDSHTISSCWGGMGGAWRQWWMLVRLRIETLPVTVQTGGQNWWDRLRSESQGENPI